ncbi:RNA polymerase sigma factor [Nitratireductor soli]|uniref:RNA polymerase sigma factor n=1 Tax=Nitratireductor soli TaxID=1670619 RepID=UPI000A9A164F
MTTTDPARQAAERVARESYGRLLAVLATRTGDIPGAEDALGEALAAALRQWPEQGVPANPEAWLVAVARRRQVDTLRRRVTARSGEEHLTMIADELGQKAGEHPVFPDRRLALMLACTHSTVDPAMRAPLMLQVLLGLTASEIGAAYLVPPATMGQRLVRAKARIKELGIRFEEPDAERLARDLPAVLDAIYATFTSDWVCRESRNRAEEAIWLAQCVVAQVPSDPEAKGLLALMLYLSARMDAQSGPDGGYVPLDEQDVSRWDHAAIDTAEALLRAANQCGPSGRFQIEAAIQSVHCARRSSGRTDWVTIGSLYDLLFALLSSPVVRLNRALARSHIDGAAAVLGEVIELGRDPRMVSYQPYWAARSHLAAEAGERETALEIFGVAIGLTTDPAVRAYLMKRRQRLLDG